MTFLDLPTEVRAQIYENVLVNEPPYILPDDYYDEENDSQDWDETFHPVHKYPLGLYKPFSYQTAQWQYVCSEGFFVVFEESILRHRVPAICHTNHQIRMEALSLFVQSKLYIGMEALKHCVDGLNQLRAMLPEDVIAGVCKLHVGIRADVKNKKVRPGRVTPTALGAQENAGPSERWERETGKDEVTGIWPLIDVSQDGLPAFKLSILESTLQVKTHYALVPDQASKLHRQIQSYHGRKVDGETLFSIAQWLRSQDEVDAYEVDGWVHNRFSWQFEAEGDEVVFHEREMLKGQFREWYSPKKLFGHVVASVEIQKS